LEEHVSPKVDPLYAIVLVQRFVKARGVAGESGLNVLPEFKDEGKTTFFPFA
jgi:hypothetical protein